MDLPRRTLLLAAAALPRLAAAADLPTLVCPLAEAPGLLVPGVSASLATRLVGGQIYRGLLRWGTEGTLEPDLAIVTASPDGLTYTAELRPGVTWHDSGGVSSADVAFSLVRFHRALQPALRLERLAVDTPGPLTVVMKLPEPDPAFPRHLEALSLPIVPQHVHDRPGWALDPRQTTPVGTGPFRYGDWLNLVRFEWYAGPMPSLAAVAFPILPQPGARTALAEAGGLAMLVGDAVDLPSVPRLRARPGLTVEGQYPPAARTVAGLRLNPRAPPLDGQEVRLALACAIDRAAAVREGWSGLGREAAAALPDYNPRVAADHLRAAGLRSDDTGIRARLTCLHPPGPAWQPMLNGVRRSLAQVGIVLAAEAVTDAEWTRRVAAGEYELAVFLAGQGDDVAGDDVAGDGPAISVLPLVEPALPVVRPTRLRLPRGALGNFEGAGLD